MLTVMTQRVTIASYVSSAGLKAQLASDVRDGLTSSPKLLLPKYFYDSTGSALFERITALPEYYLTRAENEILTSIADDLVARLRPLEVVELGAGSPTKFRQLLDADHSPRSIYLYIPIDVDAAAVQAAAEELTRIDADLCVYGIVGDIERHLDRVPEPTGRRLVTFLGSTIGNFPASERRVLLPQMRRLLRPDDLFLLGLDLVKDKATLERAYNDSQGVTAEFNRNILQVINRELDADFPLPAFRHHAFYNAEASRIEMHLIPESPQVVHIRQLGLEIRLTADESIWTESSYKFTRDSAVTMLEDAGLELEEWATDSANAFALALARPAYTNSI